MVAIFYKGRIISGTQAVSRNAAMRKMRAMFNSGLIPDLFYGAYCESVNKNGSVLA